MKVITLRKMTAMPDAYKGVPEFYVRIGGEITRCTSLADAQRATAYCPQTAPVTLMTADVASRSEKGKKQ